MNQNILTIISCHTDSDIKIRSLIHNIKYFLEISSHIAIINSDIFRSINLKEKIQEVYKNVIINNELNDEQCYAYKNKYKDLKNLSNNELREHWSSFGKKENRTFFNSMYNIYFDYIPNDKFVCHGKWIYYLNKIDYINFTNIILTNDSFIITRSLFDFKQLIKPNIELVALLESNQEKHHYPDFLRAYNVSGIKKLLNYYEMNKENITDFLSVVLNYEINSSYIFNNVDVLYKNKNQHDKNIHFDDNLMQDHIYNKNYPVIKIKKILFNDYDINELPLDFDSKEYKVLNNDLEKFSDEDATKHFLNHGINEGRLHKKNQVNVLPYFLENYLKLIGFDPH
jgi:hypothetical protein